MSQFGEYAKWFGKRITAGIVITGVVLAAWNWKHQGDDNGAHAAIHEEPERPQAEPQNHQSVPEGRLAQPSHPPIPKMANDNWPENIRQLSRQDQRKRLYIYLPPNISMEEAERW